MKIFIWRHNKTYSSWSMFDEPNIYKKGYFTAEVIVAAESLEQALELLKTEPVWDIEELKRIEPEVVSLERPAIIRRLIDGDRH